MIKMQKTKGKWIKKTIIVLLYTLSVLSMLLAAGCAVGGVWLEEHMSRALGEDQMTTVGLPPRLYAWNFSDRGERIG